MKVEAKGELSLNEERGEKCCKDCTKGTEPFDYTKVNYKGVGRLELTAFPPGLGLVYKLPTKKFASLKAEAEIELGPGVKGFLSAGVQGESIESDCETDDCSKIEYGVFGNAAIGVFAKVSGKVISCSVLDAKDCLKLVAIGAEASSAINLPASFKFLQNVGAKCSKTNCYNIGIEKVEYKSEAKLEFELGGVYKGTYQTDVAIVLSDGYKVGDCD